ncbi:MAG: hypothetical protein CMF48_02650 [Legionellales bacterium]|nr:hypothetical protein [Legionellales bacterium]
MQTKPNETFGYMLPESVSKVISRFKQADKFLDIGSGYGDLVFQVASETHLNCTGVEINQNAYARSCSALRQLNRAYASRVALICDDILKTEYNSEIVYCCNTAFSLSFQYRLTHWLDKQPSIKQIFTLRPLINSQSYTIKTRFLVSCSWDNALCYEYWSKQP